MTELLIVALAGGLGLSVAALLAASGAGQTRLMPAKVRSKRPPARR